MPPRDERTNNIKLVKLVEKNPCLYNYKLKEYAKREVTDKVWEHVANEMDDTASSTILTDLSKQRRQKLKLVKLVEKYPCLYNNKQGEGTDQIWEHIANEMDDTVSNCKSTWRNLRTVFVRKTKSPGGCRDYYMTRAMQFILPYVKSKDDTWRKCSVNDPAEYLVCEQDEESQEYLTEEEDATENGDIQDVLTMLPIKRRQRTTYYENDVSPKSKSSKYDDGDTSFQQSFVDFVQMKKANMRQKGMNEMNPRKMFLFSLLPDLYKLSDSQMLTFKRKTMETVENLLNENISNTPDSENNSQVS